MQSTSTFLDKAKFVDFRRKYVDVSRTQSVSHKFFFWGAGGRGASL